MQRYVPSIIHIVATLIITRQITPQDFGEVALVTTFCQISILFVSSGLGEGLIYRAQKTKLQYSSVFYFNIVIAVLLYLFIWGISNKIAIFYGLPRVSILCKVIGLDIIIYAISYIQRVIYQTNINFKKWAYISLVASIIGSAVGIVLAFGGFGVWSIVFMTITLNIIETILLWVFSSWRPSLLFSWSEIRLILPYSARILINNFVQVLYDNIYSLVLGKVLGSRQLGFYNRMQTVVYFTTTNFMYSIESVFFPILCKNKANRDVLMNTYESLIRMATYISSYVLLILVVYSEQIIKIVLGDLWVGGSTVLRLMAIAFLFVPISYINNSFLKITNNTKILLYSNFLKKIIGLIILVCTILTKQINVICLGIIIYYLVDAFISMICVRNYVYVGFFKQLSYMKNNVFLCVSSATISSVVLYLPVNDFLTVSVGIFIFSAIYILLGYFFKTRESILLNKIINNLGK